MQNNFPYIDDTAVTSASTNHSAGKAAADVTALTINNKQIYQIPTLSDIFVNLNYIYIKNTPLRHLKRKHIDGYNSTLKHFVVTDSYIQIIDGSLFYGFTKLETIDVQNNRIFYIHANAFKALDLKILKISQNLCTNPGSGDVGNYPDSASSQLTLDQYITKIAASTCSPPADMDMLLSNYQDLNDVLYFEVEKKILEYEDLLELKDQESTACKASLDSKEQAIKDSALLLQQQKDENLKLTKKVADLTKNSESLKIDLQNAQQEATVLKSQIKYLESLGEQCLDVNGTCRFTRDDVDGYSCIAHNISINSPKMEVNWTGEHIPSSMQDKNVVTLKIQGLNVQFVPVNIHVQFYRLQKLIIDKCGLKKLSNLDFLKLFFLKSIEITSNNITSIDPDTFEDVTLLEILDLSNNKIQSFPSKIFNNLEYLNTLKFADILKA
ncbi:leucine-rich repeat-containing G-protein coupled receptor 4-like [Chironomus tepperi]|uniref:leucine-rich repeat-containing G-protein coupled receptor 4-like n=1 Tax=Chironomus tepperi TaxID=113505 RepID=UPI00391F19E2